MDETVTDIELPHLSVSTKTSPSVKDICIDEGVQMFEKILVEYDKVEPAFFSSSNFSNGNSALVETRENENSGNLKPLSTNEGLGSLGKILERDVGGTEVSSPSKCAVCLNETIYKSAKKDLRSFLVAGYPVEQCYCSSSVSERKPSDTSEIAPSKRPFKEIIHLSEEFNIDVPQADSSSQDDRTFANQDLRPKLYLIAEEEQDWTTMSTFSPDKTTESELIAGTVSSNKDGFKEDKTSEFVVTSNNTNGASDDLKIDGVAPTSYLKAGDASIVGNENKVVNNQQRLQSQNGGKTEEPASDGTTSARTSFSHLAYGDLNLLGPASFSGSITSTHVTNSGNISLRSESSTTSCQSFAFPVLQPEWSSSPIKMAKADRRHLRRHRWKTALTCCKF